MLKINPNRPRKVPRLSESEIKELDVQLLRSIQELRSYGLLVMPVKKGLPQPPEVQFHDIGKNK